jgi:hypothetical protein
VGVLSGQAEFVTVNFDADRLQYQDIRSQDDFDAAVGLDLLM